MGEGLYVLDPDYTSGGPISRPVDELSAVAVDGETAARGMPVQPGCLPHAQ